MQAFCLVLDLLILDLDLDFSDRLFVRNFIFRLFMKAAMSTIERSAVMKHSDCFVKQFVHVYWEVHNAHLLNLKSNGKLVKHFRRALCVVLA